MSYPVSRTLESLQGERIALSETGEGPMAFFLRGAVRVARGPGGRGCGLEAARPLAAGTVLWQSDLEARVTSVSSIAELLEMPREQRREYAEYTWFIGGHFFGPRRDLPVAEATQLEVTNLINHSCEPNVGFRGDHNLVAMRDIAEGETMCTDYAMTEWKAVNWDSMTCECGTPSCRKTISCDDWRLPQVQERLRGHFTSAVQRLIDFQHLPESFFGTGGSRELNKSIEVRPHPNFPGHGLFAREPIASGQLLWRNNGVECQELPIEYVRNATGAEKEFLLHYGYQVDGDTWSAPLSLEWMKAGNDDSSYMNHSCDPTVYVLTPDMWIARRDIAADEEITYDYAMSETQFDRLPECLCGGPMCRGKVTRDDWKRQDLRRRYLLSFSNHVLELMAQEDQWLKPE